METAAAYSVSSGSDEMQKKTLSSYDRRRLELKELTLERRRREEDRAHMIIEDKLGEALREFDRQERQRRKWLEVRACVFCVFGTSV